MKTIPVFGKLLNPSRLPRSLLLIIALGTSATAWNRARAQDGDELNGNTAEGNGALHTYIATANSSSFDTAIGLETLYDNTTGYANTATGAQALFSNMTGNYNTATGFGALKENSMTSANTATGANALASNSNGSDNTATGYAALTQNQSGSENTANGVQALYFNFTGGNNTASGFGALFDNSTGSQNTATGTLALSNNIGGHDNTAEGFQALLHTTGSNNTGYGSNAGVNLTTGSNNIDIGANVAGIAGEANTIRVGKQGTQQKTFIAGISGKTVASGVGVIINSTGQLGTIQSSARFKTAIQPMDKASEAILKLKPVTFRYKEELDPDDVPQFGLIAEEVGRVDPDLVVRDEDGKVTTVRYEAVNAMLLNEFLKEHRKAAEEHRSVEEQARTIQELKGLVTNQQKQIEKLTAGLQEVSDEIELARPAPTVGANN